MSDHISKCGEIIPMSTRSSISTRYHSITRAVNREFWNSSSDTLHSLYVGSYGRGTAVDTSDIDVLVELPKAEYDRYDYYNGNGQSRLLQAVKNAILRFMQDPENAKKFEEWKKQRQRDGSTPKK